MITNKEELELIKEMEVFTKEVFEYYNGIINTIIGDYLVLEILYYDFEYYAEQRNINIRIYLSSCIKNTTNKDVIKFRIIKSLLHELYHTTQFLIPIEYMAKQNNINLIENQAIILTQSYIIQNIIDIQNRWNININNYDNFLKCMFNIKNYTNKLNSIGNYIDYAYTNPAEIILSILLNIIAREYDLTKNDYFGLYNILYCNDNIILNHTINNTNNKYIIKENGYFNLKYINILNNIDLNIIYYKIDMDIDYNEYNSTKEFIIDIKFIDSKNYNLCTFNNSSNS